MKILVTGSKGFVGKNLVYNLRTNSNYEILEVDVDTTLDTMEEYTKICDFVFHFAGVNRTTNSDDFRKTNCLFTKTLCEMLYRNDNQAPIVASSSAHATIDNDYGNSKKEMEEVLLQHQKNNNSKVFIYRLNNLFGKFSRPNYNSVIATWCFNVANGKEIMVDNENTLIKFCYIDDVINEFISLLEKEYVIDQENSYYDINTLYEVSLKTLKDLIISFKESRKTFKSINTKDEFTNKLYATYLSYLSEDDFSYKLKMNIDDRGSFTEFLKDEQGGQVSINISKPGIVKGNHWHNTKNEKFLVVSGQGVIRFRRIDKEEIIEYRVSGNKLEVVDIPVGYTHNIENIGQEDMVTVMWANEMFDPKNPDTFYEEV